MREQHGSTVEEQSRLRFGNYDLVRRIDVGGMGEVYLARQRTAFDRKVAVKIIRSDLMHDLTARARFLREAEVSAHLKHEHILSLVEFGEDQGRLFLVTPYIDGGTLARRLRSGPLSLTEVHQLFVPLVQAVAYIHRRGVIHRDLKPTNILLDSQDGQVYVRLIDFGIASVQGAAVSAPLTTAGNEMGTVAYMAPERLSGVAAPSNDIFSLGVILYQMLTGHFPTPQMKARLPQPLEYVVQHSIAPRPADRFGSAEEVLRAFERACQYTIAAPSQQISPDAPAIPWDTSQSRSGRPANTPLHPAGDNGHGDDFEEQEEDENEAVSLLLEEEMPVLELEAEGGFSQADFGAPTTTFDPAKERVQGKQHSARPSTAKISPARKKRPGKRRGSPVLAIVSLLMVVVLAIIAGLLYYGYQAAAITSVSINFGPKTQVINQVYTITANTHAKNIDVASRVIPAKLPSEKKQDAMTGPTTGKINCIFGIIACQQSVSDSDVSTLTDQIRSGLIPSIRQDLQGKIIAAGGTQVGLISFQDVSSTANPMVGAISNTVTVTLVEQGTVGYIVKGDAQNLARQLLAQQVGKNFTLISSTINVGDPVIEGVDNNGVVTIKIAAGGVELYHFPQQELQNIQNHLEGLSTGAARAFIALQPGVDAKTIAIRFTQGSGTMLPSDVQHIRIISINPVTYPAFDLQQIATPVPTSTTTATPTTNT